MKQSAPFISFLPHFPVPDFILNSFAYCLPYSKCSSNTLQTQSVWSFSESTSTISWRSSFSSSPARKAVSSGFAQFSFFSLRILFASFSRLVPSAFCSGVGISGFTGVSTGAITSTALQSSASTASPVRVREISSCALVSRSACAKPSISGRNARTLTLPKPVTKETVPFSSVSAFAMGKYSPIFNTWNCT